jgi:hypothetical protein
MNPKKANIRISINPENIRAFVSRDEESDFEDLSNEEAANLIRKGATVTVACGDTDPHHNWETPPTTAFKV